MPYYGSPEQPSAAVAGIQGAMEGARGPAQAMWRHLQEKEQMRRQALLALFEQNPRQFAPQLLKESGIESVAGAGPTTKKEMRFWPDQTVPNVDPSQLTALRDPMAEARYAAYLAHSGLVSDQNVPQAMEAARQQFPYGTPPAAPTASAAGPGGASLQPGGGGVTPGSTPSASGDLGPWGQYVKQASEKYGVPTAAILALIQREGANNNPAIQGPSVDDQGRPLSERAVGLMQVMPGTAAMYGVSPQQLTNPYVNIDVGTRHWANLIKKHGGNVLSAARDWGGDKPPYTTDASFAPLLAAQSTGAAPGTETPGGVADVGMQQNDLMNAMQRGGAMGQMGGWNLPSAQRPNVYQEGLMDLLKSRREASAAAREENYYKHRDYVNEQQQADSVIDNMNSQLNASIGNGNKRIAEISTKMDTDRMIMQPEEKQALTAERNTLVRKSAALSRLMSVVQQVRGESLDDVREASRRVYMKMQELDVSMSPYTSDYMGTTTGTPGNAQAAEPTGSPNLLGAPLQR